MEPSDVAAAVLGLVTNFAKFSSELNQGVFSHLAQGLGVVNTNLIHQHGGVGDDPGLIAALQAAVSTPAAGSVIRVPQSGNEAAIK